MDKPAECEECEDRKSGRCAKWKKDTYLLTAEPELCEDEHKMVIEKVVHVDTRDEIICRALNVQLQNADDALINYARKYASRVADKRVEELRAQVDMLRTALKQISKHGTHRTHPCKSLDGCFILPSETRKTEYAVIADKALAATDPKQEVEVIPMPGEAPPVVASKRFEQRSERTTDVDA